MRVLHVYSGNLFGGIETFLLTLARFADVAPTMHSEFALCFEGRLQRELLEAGATVHQLGHVRVRAPWTLTRARGRLARLVREGAYDVVVCHSVWTQALLGPAAKSGPGRMVFWLHDAPDHRGVFELWAGRTLTDLAICNSQFTLGTLDRIFRRVPAAVEFYPVALEPARLSDPERTGLRAELGAGPETTVVIQVSRMEPWKGQLRHLRALSRLPPAADWLCVLVGGPQRPVEHAYFQQLKATAESLGIAGRVRFLGQRNDVPRLLAAADVQCQPNAGAEPFGVVFIEAMAAGLPVVTMDMGGPREIITPEVGFLAADEDALTNALRALVHDRALGRRLGAAGPSRARELCDPSTRLPAIERALAGAPGPS